MVTSRLSFLLDQLMRYEAVVLSGGEEETDYSSGEETLPPSTTVQQQPPPDIQVGTYQSGKLARGENSIPYR